MYLSPKHILSLGDYIAHIKQSTIISYVFRVPQLEPVEVMWVECLPLYIYKV